MAGTPIKLTFYDPDTSEEATTFSRSFIPSKMLKAVLMLLKRLGKIDLNHVEDIPPEIADEIMGLVVEFYGNQFTIDELGEFSDMRDMISVFYAIAARAEGIVPNPPPPPEIQ